MKSLRSIVNRKGWPITLQANMMATTIERTYEICCSHQLEGHPKCSRIHGHNYVITVAIMADINPAKGWIMDFGDLDRDVVKPILDQMDHMYLVSLENLEKKNKHALLAIEDDQAFSLGTPQSTAEMISDVLARLFFIELSKHMEVTNCTVTVQETSRSSATTTCFYIPEPVEEEIGE